MKLYTKRWRRWRGWTILPQYATHLFFVKKRRIYHDEYDEEDRSYEDEGFIQPTLEKAINHLAMNNGDGADYVFKIENVETGAVLFEDDPSYIEDEEDGS